ncbi:MAG: hypothetical protein DLM65_00300 [Candidatus Aeolococcus gillhamiae]|uniref:DUF2079 domain-containing protein n=1 Tax=Candidatus Aeolococcus gillhamiae TaxID=3127015 RepID=A0A2W5ZM64_9BACT|nr:MAG: hypothetical protein DLM65_00300 [Candidatus Dormibacter sp. RRmetagenome_bin12]
MIRRTLLQRGPLLVAVATALVVATTTLLRYLTFHSPAYDLGFFEQVTEQTAHGHLFVSAFLPYSFLGEHWEPLLGVFAQFDRLVPTPIWLLLIEAVAVGAAPLAAARLAAAWLPLSKAAPLVAALAMACSPLLTTGAAFDYHTEALTPAVALFALDAAARGRFLRFVLLLLLLAAIKEDALLVVAGVGWIAWRADGRRIGLAAAGAGVAGFLTLVIAVMPFFRHGLPTDLLKTYGWLSPASRSVAHLLVTAISHPGTVMSHLLSHDALYGWAIALLPLALLPLLSGWALLGALAVLLVPLMTNVPAEMSLHYQYGLEAAPLLLACALLGWRRLASDGAARQRRLGALLAATSVAAYAVAAPLPGALGFDASTVSGVGRHADVERLLGLIPPNAPVAAQTGLVAHLGNRASLWEFPSGLGVPYVVLDAEGPISTQSRHGFARAVAELPSAGYAVMAAAAGVTLWARCSVAPVGSCAHRSAAGPIDYPGLAHDPIGLGIRKGWTYTFGYPGESG